MKEVNYLYYSGLGDSSWVTMSNPGLIDPGIIVIGKSKQTNTQGWADAMNNIPVFEFEDSPAEFIQYKADTNKFLGYIGDLTEYKFKHIPEKYYYNNISKLELLTSDDQTYIGSNLPVLKAISDHSVFSELIGEDYKDPSSIPNGNYDKFKPRYFGTAQLGDRTVMIFMVPPGYDTVFISNGTEVYSKDEYFGIYGVQFESQEINQEYINGIGGTFNSPHPSTPGVDYSNTDNMGINNNSSVVDSSTAISTVEMYVEDILGENTVPGTNSDPEPNTGGRGRGNGNTIVSTILDDNYSLVTDSSLGLTLVIPTSEMTEAEINPEMLLYDYWFPSSSYEFTELQDFNFYIKRKVSQNSSSFRYFKIDNLLSNTNSLKEYISNTDNFKPYEPDKSMLDVVELESAEDGSYSIYCIYVYIYVNKTYKNIRGISKYTFESDTNYSGKIYKKVTEVEENGETKPIQDVQLIKFKWDHNSNPGVGRLVEFLSLPTKGPNSNGWYIKKYKDGSSSTNFISRDKTNIDIDTSQYEPNVNWDNIYGKANYFKYLENTCQVKIKLSESLDDYYKLVKLVISPVETQEYRLVEYSGSISTTVKTFIPGTILKCGNDTLQVEYIWTPIESLNPGEEVLEILDYLPTSSYKTEYRIGNVIRVGDIRYRLTNYSLVKVSADSVGRLNIKEIININDNYFVVESSPVKSSIESLNIVNLGYKTSENPLKNLDKYLVRDETFIKKYSKENFGIIDLTSGSLVSSNLRKREDESYVDFIKYSYRKNYRKGQTVLIGVPNNLNPRIIDIQHIVPSIYTDQDENENESIISKDLIGSIVYDYSDGLVYKIGLDEDTQFGKIDIIYSKALPSEQYLYRYRGEYYLWKEDNYKNGELFRAGKLDVRTWISLVDNNQGKLPGMSRNWISRDGNLTVGDKIWVMVMSGNTQRKVLGEIVKKSSTSTGSTGTSIKIICEKLQSPVQLNGVKVNVDGTEVPTEENGIKRYAYYLYLEKQYKRGRSEVTVIADITNNLVFKDKINYLIN